MLQARGKARFCLGGVLSEWVWGPLLECGEGEQAVSGASACTKRPPLPYCPPSPCCLRFPRKTRRPGNHWGHSDRSTPGAPTRDRPTHLKGPWLQGLPPPADSPHTCGRHYL